MQDATRPDEAAAQEEEDARLQGLRERLGEHVLRGLLGEFAECVLSPWVHPIGSPVDTVFVWEALTPADRETFCGIAAAHFNRVQDPPGREHRQGWCQNQGDPQQAPQVTVRGCTEA